MGGGVGWGGVGGRGEGDEFSLFLDLKNKYNFNKYKGFYFCEKMGS